LRATTQKGSELGNRCPALTRSLAFAACRSNKERIMRTDPNPEYLIDPGSPSAGQISSAPWLNAARGISPPHQQEADTAGKPVTAAPLASEVADLLDLSAEAVAAAEAHAQRSERIIAIRQAIARGDYALEDKLSTAIERLLAELARNASSQSDPQ
jgi:anti-sigma28 factor (negative regulator of flagellin synthesis)